jgi:hypothetical protein
MNHSGHRPPSSVLHLPSWWRASLISTAPRSLAFLLRLEIIFLTVDFGRGGQADLDWRQGGALALEDTDSEL